MPSAEIRPVGALAGTWTDGSSCNEAAVTSVSGTAPVADLIASLTRKLADSPWRGVRFKDLAPLFAAREGMTAVTEALAGIASGADLVAGIDSRGFLVAAGGAGRAGPRGRGH